MATNVVIQNTPLLVDPKWEKIAAKPGEEVQLEVTTQNFTVQSVGFEVRDASDRLLAILDDDGTHKGKWLTPMTPDTSVDGLEYSFFALLREKPTAANGHLGVMQRIKSTNTLKVKGTKLTITSLDKAFVPKQENLEMKFKVEGAEPVKGQIEIWGERYPTNKPLYTEKFTYKAGDFVPVSDEITWKKWDGKVNDTKTYLNCKATNDKQYLTPEFGPYRVRVVVGPDEGTVDDPYGAGLGKVAIAEKQFEVKFESIQIRIMEGLTEAVAADVTKRQYKLENILVIGEPDANSGEYRHGTGRLPCVSSWQANFRVAADGDRDFDVKDFNANHKYKHGGNELTLWLNKTKLTAPADYEEVDAGLLTKLSTKIKLKAGLSKEKDVLWVMRVDPLSTPDDQKARIRIPMARHNLRTDELDMGDPRTVAGSYMKGGASIKYDLDKSVYTRPELPIEFVPKLTSNDETKNAKPYLGLVEPAAMGPLRIEPVAEDNYLEELYTYTATGGNTTHKEYFKNAHFKVKRGTDSAPQHASNKPIFSFWQWRHKMTADVAVDTEYDFSTFDDTLKYKVAAPDAADSDLMVWLNRALLNRKVDYEEVGATASESNKIKLKKDLAKDKDVLWVVRKDLAATGGDLVDGWTRGPSGTNCHIYYGGLRGGDPSDPKKRLFRKNFSADPASPLEPIIGKSTADLPFKDNNFIQPKPDPVDLVKQERFEVTTLLEGDKIGLAGIIFSPSCIGSDSYILRARIDQEPYVRGFGEVQRKPQKEGQTGPITMWRWMQLAKSFRCPDKGIGGKRADIGSDPEAAVGGRAYKGDGKNVNLGYMNSTLLAKAYNEWTVPVKFPVTGASYSGTDPIEITTAVPHGMDTGDKVKIAEVDGNTNANGTWTIAKLNDTKFALYQGVSPGLTARAGNAAYTVGGTAEPVELHKDIDLETYVTQHDNKCTTLGAGQVLIRNARTLQIVQGTDGNPVQIYTFSDHYLETGDQVTIAGVTTNPALNGDHTITKVDNTHFTLDGVDGSTSTEFWIEGTAIFKQPAPVAITSASNENPIKITTAAPHKMNTRERVTITGVVGNAAANGSHVITKVDATSFTLDGVKGNGAGTGGTVKSRDLHHRNITEFLVQYDSYRIKLPVGTDAARQHTATKAVRYLTPGTSLSDAKFWIGDQISGMGGPDVPAPGPIPFAPTTWSDENYFWWAHGQFWKPVSEAILDHLTPREPAKPKVMNLVRWPYLHDNTHPYAWQGECFGNGQSLIHSQPDEVTLFAHEMGHSMNLVHFLGGNFGWKHHDLGFPQCMMSYGHMTHSIPKPGTGAGGGGAFDSGAWPRGWPDTDKKTFRKLDDPPKIDLAEPCARCMLKLQGWKEDVLPTAWFHQDVF